MRSGMLMGIGALIGRELCIAVYRKRLVKRARFAISVLAHLSDAVQVPPYSSAHDKVLSWPEL